MEERKYFKNNHDYLILEEAYSELGLVCKEIFKLLYEKRLNLQEAAEELGISNELVRKRRQRCLENLKMILKRRYKK